MYPVLVSPYMSDSEKVYERFEELRRMEVERTLVDESPEQAELSVLRTLLSANPGDRLTFEESFPHFYRYADDASSPMKKYYDLTVAAWTKVHGMIGIPAE